MSGKNTDKSYVKRAEELTPPSPFIKNGILAFISGGFLSTAGELLFNIYSAYFTEKDARTLVSVTFIVITAILTGIGIYDKIAKHAGAGVFVPISGFANSVCAPAIEYAAEGRIFGTSEKMFSLAGAVIVYGCSLASVCGAVYYFFGG